MGFLNSILRRFQYRIGESNRRERFNEVQSQALHNTHAQLKNRNSSITDEEIISAYISFSDKIETNTFAAAELEWVTVSVLCFYRPLLARRLIRRGLLSIVYSIGDNIDATVVLEFIRQRILDNPAPYGGVPPDPGMTWLKNLSSQTIMIQAVLEEVITENNEELERLGLR